MTELTLDTAQKIAAATLKTAREKSFKPLAVVVYDARGALKALLSEDGTSLKRAEIAMGKAYGALALGRRHPRPAQDGGDRPTFIASATHAVGGQLVPVPGGVLIKDAQGATLDLWAFRATPPTMTRSLPLAGSRPRDGLRHVGRLSPPHRLKSCYSIKF